MSGAAVLAAALAGATAALAWAPRPRTRPPERPPGSGPTRACVSLPPGPAAGEEGLRRYRAPLAVLAGVAVALLLGGWVGAVAGGPAAVVAWQLIGRLEPPVARRRRERLVRQLPHVVELLAATLTVGAATGRAVEVVADAVDQPARAELEAIARRLRLGVDPVRVWSEVGRHPQLGPLGRCLARATASGASVAEAMQRLAEDQRRDSRAGVETRARSVGVKAAAPLGLCLLPAFVLVGVVPLVVGSVTALLAR